MKKITLLIAAFLVINNLSAQDGQQENPFIQNPRLHKPFGISVGAGKLLGDEHLLFLISTDYFATAQVNIQVNVGLNTERDPYFSAGTKFHLNSYRSQRGFTPYTGLLAGAETGSAFLQVPVGVNYISPGGLNVALGINQIFSIKERGQMTMLELSLGWRLKR